MPTINYEFQPTDQVYFIDYCEKMKTEAVVKGTIYRIDITINGISTPATSGTPAIIAQDATPATPATPAIPAVEQVPTDQEIIDNTVAAELFKTNTLDPAIAERDAAQTTLDDALVANSLATSTNATNAEQAATQAAVDSAQSVLSNKQNAVNVAQSNHDDLVAQTVITTEAADAVPAAPAMDAKPAIAAAPAVPATEQIIAGLEFKYMIQANYNQKVCIEDDSLLFTNKEDAFDALEERVA